MTLAAMNPCGKNIGLGKTELAIKAIKRHQQKHADKQQSTAPYKTY